jgi:hypothetical protein
MTKRILLALASVIALRHAVCGSNNPMTKRGDNMKITLKIGDKALIATLIDSKTAHDFLSLLPLTVTMNDLFGREKFAHLPRAISTDRKRTHKYELGDIAYWSPGPDVAVYYRHDDEKIPNPGIIVIGKLDSGVEAFNVPGSVEVKITANVQITK